MFELNSILHSLKELLLFVVNLFGPALDASTLETVEAINALSLDCELVFWWYFAQLRRNFSFQSVGKRSSSYIDQRL